MKQQDQPGVAVGVSRYRTPLILSGLGSVALFCYLAINVLIPRSPRYMAHQRAVLIDDLPFWSALVRLPIPIPQTSLTVVTIAASTAIVALACYTIALWLSRSMTSSSINVGIVLGFMVLFCLTSVLMLPNAGSGDLFAYIKQARVFTVYHANPYANPPILPDNDPYVQLHGPMPKPTPYGPLWTYLAILWASLAGDDIISSVLAFRLLLFAFNLANVALIWHILGRLNPAYRFTGLIFYAWSPLIVLEGMLHLDVVMAFFVLLSVYLSITRRTWFALVALTCSILVKFITAPLLIVYLSGLWRRRSFWFAIMGLGLAGTLVLLAFLPVWEGWEMFLMLAREPRQEPGTLSFRRLLFLPGFLVTILWACRQGRGTIDDMLRGWGAIMLWFSLFLMPPQYPWYLTTLIALVSLIESRQIGALALAVCFSSLLSDMLGQFAKPYASLPITLFRLIWWGPALLALIWVYQARLRQLFLRAREVALELL